MILKNNAANIRSIILKQSSWDKREESEKELLEKFAHEWVGLKFLNKVSDINHVVPEFFEGNYQHKFILLEDFDDPHISLVDSSTGSDKDKALLEREEIEGIF